MPEGPEIQLAADAVAAAIAGRPTTAVSFAFDQLKKYEEVLTGVEVTAVQARGKAMLTRFANGYNIYSHNQLYGKWMVRDGCEMREVTQEDMNKTKGNKSDFDLTESLQAMNLFSLSLFSVMMNMMIGQPLNSAGK